MRKRKSFVITIVLVVLVGVGWYAYEQYKSTTLDATDLLENVDFNDKESLIEATSSKSLKTADIPEETQKELLKAFENAKFKELKDNEVIHPDYEIKISAYGRYGLFVDTSNKFVYVDDSKKKYLMVDDNGFFDILKSTTK